MRGRRKYEKMNIINVENITKSYTGRKLFSKASFYVQENEKIGIIGINGTGKSTLLKIVAGDEEPDEGTVTTANHIVINYLPQNPEFDPDETALEHVMGRVVTSQLDEDMRWSIESDAKSLLMKLDITDMAQKTGELSGGQRKRLALATVVLKPCDVLILDEPTNHLDYEMVEWLEDYLRRFRGAIIMITHDLGVISRLCDRVVVMYGGKIVEKGEIGEIFYNTAHPYTKGLMQSIAKLDTAKGEKLKPIEGTPPDLFAPPKGCPFAARCEYCMDVCEQLPPEAYTVADDHTTFCWLQHEMAPETDLKKATAKKGEV